VRPARPAFREGWIAIKAGLFDTVLCIGVEKMAPGMIVKKKVGNEPLPAEGLIGSETMPAVFSAVGLEHARKYGTTLEQFARVSVKNHHHSTFNPKSMYQKETPLQEVLSAEMIAYPNTKLMCSVNVDGAAAAVLMSERRVRERGLSGRAVRVRASALASDAWSPRIRSCRMSTRCRVRRPRQRMRWPAWGLTTCNWSSCTIASRRLRSCTMKISVCAPKAKAGV